MNRPEPPGKVIRRLQRRFAQDEDEVRLRAGLDELHAELAAEIRDILTRDQAESVQLAAREAQAATPEGPGLRHHSLVEARRRGIDLNQLRSIQRSARRKFEDLVHAGDGFSPSEIDVRALVPPFNWPPAVEPPPATSAVIYPPFEIAWERDTFRQAAGDAWIMEFESYLDTQWGQLGTWMAGRNHDTGDSDWVNLFHLGGFLIPFTMPTTSVLYIRAELTCLVCEHSITTSDEWGWSDFIAFTRTGVKFDVLWERDDGEPMNQGFRERFVPGLDASGDGESFPGTKVVVGPGEQRTADFITDMAFPQGKTIWVHIGLSDFAYAHVNDVSVDVSMNSAWQLSSLTLTAL